MLTNQTTVFKNDLHFGGDIVLTTDVTFEESTHAYVTVVVIPNDLTIYGGGAMVWELQVKRNVAETHEELLEELKKEKYITEGSSVVEDIIGEPALPSMRELLTAEVMAHNEDLTEEQARDVVRGLEEYIGGYLAEQIPEQIEYVTKYFPKLTKEDE